MRIIEVIIEAVDPTGANTVVENHTEVLSRGEGDSKIINRDLYPSHGSYNNNNNNNNNNCYGNYQGRGGHGHGGNYYRPCSHGRGNYRSHNNYQYHQYYTHDDGSQFEQYGPPCALCGGFNHSPKHCFKGEHDINNLMEKMSLGSSNQHQNGLY